MLEIKTVTNKKNILPILLLVVFGCSDSGVSISEEMRELTTYPFSEPNPIPILTQDKRLYPYHKFVGYSHDGIPKKWKVIKMENEHIKVYVLPEVGGKVWGAIDKSNGEEFIYRNEVMKFRNISLRGPWTSGGIEFNFGVIGHTPATATPVDYVTKRNNDGSVSTFVGGMDLPSRTQWRVEIKVEKGRSNFETKATWYNPTPMVQPYYNWMTAAAFAQDDLELVFPGNKYLKHSGEVKSWPTDGEGRNLSLYDNNRFEGHKSYHVVGEWKNFFGGYYHDDGYGFGHWSNHDEMPGQKLWLWALSRQGGIWEDHLTDTDGQYIEFQAGRQLVQYSPGDHNNPIRKAEFDPYGTDLWTEYWFPVKDIGGIKEASKNGAMNIEREGDDIQINLHSFIKSKGKIKVSSNEKIIIDQEALFEPMIQHSFQLIHPQNDHFEITVEGLDLYYNSDPLKIRVDRPYILDQTIVSDMSEEDQKFNAGYEFLKEREYQKAQELFEQVLKKSPNHLNANKGMADLYFRSGRYKKGIQSIKKNLQMNTYDPKANFIAGNLFRALGENTSAREAFGWSARSMGYRSSSYTQISELYLIDQNWDLAIDYANKALDFNRFNIDAYQILTIATRELGRITESKKYNKALLSIDPLNHFAHLESYFLNPINSIWEKYVSSINNEFPDQIHLELAISYFNRGFTKNALELLEKISEKNNNPIIQLWVSYLKQDTSGLEFISNTKPYFVFPYRRETIRVLNWAQSNSNHWEWSYLLALNLWAKDREEEALDIMDELKGLPNHGPFYAARASLRNKYNQIGVEEDLDRSIVYTKDSWPIQLHAVKYYQENDLWTKSLNLSSKANEQFPRNFNIEIMHAKSLLYMKKYDECLELLKTTKVLPSEMANESRQLFEWVNLAKSLDYIKNNKILAARSAIKSSREWPKNLGIGKPYQPDESIQNILMTYLDDPNSVTKLKMELEDLRKRKNSYSIILIEEIIKMMNTNE